MFKSSNYKFAAPAASTTANATTSAMSGTSLVATSKPSSSSSSSCHTRCQKSTLSKSSLILTLTIIITVLLSAFAPTTVAAPTIGRSGDDTNSASIYGCPSPQACEEHCRTMMNSAGYCGEYPRRSCFCTLTPM